MQNRHSEDLVLEFENVDLYMRWTMSSILTAMQTLGDIHANELSAGRAQMLEKGAYWIIARLRVDMQRYPIYLDSVTVTTWPGKPDRASFPRFFHFHSRDGQLLGTACSKYMLLHVDDHSIVSPSKVALYDQIEIRPEVCEMPGRVRFKQATQPAVVRRPVYSDIDLNRHMNNTRYAQWVCDLFPSARYKNSELSSFQLNYVSDGVEGHDISMELEERDQEFLAEGTDLNTGKIVFESSGIWRRTEG